MFEKLSKAKKNLSKHVEKVDIAIITGTGININLNGELFCENVSYSSIDGIPIPKSKSHEGYFDFTLKDKKIVCIAHGRVHYYENYSIYDVVFIARLFALLKSKVVIVTNAAGGLNPYFSKGDIMLILDHINLMGVNPLKGDNIDILGERFPDMTEAYSKKYNNILKDVAVKNAIEVKEGIYVAVAGPSMETPAETRFLRMIGADAVGMSSVPEVIALRHAGIPCVGLSIITNINKPDCMNKALIDDVINVSKNSSERLSRLIDYFIDRI